MKRFDERRRRAYDTSPCRLNPIDHARPVVVAERQARTSKERSFDAFHDDPTRRIQDDAASEQRFEQIREPLSILGGQRDGRDESRTSTCFEAGTICFLRRRTLPQGRVEQNFDPDVRDGARRAAAEPAFAKLDVGVAAQGKKFRKLMEHVVGQVVKAHAVFERRVRHRGHSNAEHRNEIGQHRSEQELRLGGEAPSDGRVAEEVHALVKSVAPLTSARCASVDEAMAGPIRRARVIGRSPLSPRVTELLLELEGDEPFRFIAGQHVVLRPDLPGGEASYFSIAAAPNQAGMRELTLASRNESELLACAPLGATVTIEGPFGEFTLRKAPGSLLVGAGTGVAPLRAIAHAALASDDDTPLVLLAGNRTSGDLLWHRELLVLASEHPRFLYAPVVSQPEPSFSGRQGYVQDHLPEMSNGLPAGFRAYCCGSTRMVSACRDVFGKLGVPPERILSEADS